MHLRVVTWNIHKGIGGVDRRYRIERILEPLRFYDADLLFLQEVDDGAPRSAFHSQAEMLARALGYRHFCYGPNVTLRRGRYGNATLSRWPLSQVRNLDLTIGPKKRRGALHARCRVRVGRRSRTVVLYNLHLGLAGFERALQLRRFLASHPFAGLHQRTPVVFAGDLNDLWGTLGPRFLDPAGFRRAGPLVPTYPAVWPFRPLDAVFVRGDLKVVRCFRSRMPVAREASDHLPLVAQLYLTSGASARGGSAQPAGTTSTGPTA